MSNIQENHFEAEKENLMIQNKIEAYYERCKESQDFLKSIDNEVLQSAFYDEKKGKDHISALLSDSEKTHHKDLTLEDCLMYYKSLLFSACITTDIPSQLDAKSQEEKIIEATRLLFAAQFGNKRAISTLRKIFQEFHEKSLPQRVWQLLAIRLEYDLLCSEIVRNRLECVLAETVDPSLVIAHINEEGKEDALTLKGILEEVSTGNDLAESIFKKVCGDIETLLDIQLDYSKVKASFLENSLMCIDNFPFEDVCLDSLQECFQIIAKSIASGKMFSDETYVKIVSLFSTALNRGFSNRNATALKNRILESSETPFFEIFQYFREMALMFSADERKYFIAEKTLFHEFGGETLDYRLEDVVDKSEYENILEDVKKLEAGNTNICFLSKYMQRMGSVSLEDVVAHVKDPDNVFRYNFRTVFSPEQKLVLKWVGFLGAYEDCFVDPGIILKRVSDIMLKRISRDILIQFGMVMSPDAYDELRDLIEPEDEIYTKLQKLIGFTKKIVTQISDRESDFSQFFTSLGYILFHEYKNEIKKTRKKENAVAVNFESFFPLAYGQKSKIVLAFCEIPEDLAWTEWTPHQIKQYVKASEQIFTTMLEYEDVDEKAFPFLLESKWICRNPLHYIALLKVVYAKMIKTEGGRKNVKKLEEACGEFVNKNFLWRDTVELLDKMKVFCEKWDDPDLFWVVSQMYFQIHNSLPEGINEAGAICSSRKTISLDQTLCEVNMAHDSFFQFANSIDTSVYLDFLIEKYQEQLLDDSCEISHTVIEEILESMCYEYLVYTKKEKRVSFKNDLAKTWETVDRKMFRNMISEHKVVELKNKILEKIKHMSTVEEFLRDKESAEMNHYYNLACDKCGLLNKNTGNIELGRMMYGYFLSGLYLDVFRHGKSLADSSVLHTLLNKHTLLKIFLDTKTRLTVPNAGRLFFEEMYNHFIENEDGLYCVVDNDFTKEKFLSELEYIKDLDVNAFFRKNHPLFNMKQWLYNLFKFDSKSFYAFVPTHKDQILSLLSFVDANMFGKNSNYFSDTFETLIHEEVLQDAPEEYLDFLCSLFAELHVDNAQNSAYVFATLLLQESAESVMNRKWFLRKFLSYLFTHSSSNAFAIGYLFQIELAIGKLDLGKTSGQQEFIANKVRKFYRKELRAYFTTSEGCSIIFEKQNNDYSYNNFSECGTLLMEYGVLDMADIVETFQFEWLNYRQRFYFEGLDDEASQKQRDAFVLAQKEKRNLIDLKKYASGELIALVIDSMRGGKEAQARLETDCVTLFKDSGVKKEDLYYFVLDEILKFETFFFMGDFLDKKQDTAVRQGIIAVFMENPFAINTAMRFVPLIAEGMGTSENKLLFEAFSVYVHQKHFEIFCMSNELFFSPLDFFDYTTLSTFNRFETLSEDELQEDSEFIQWRDTCMRVTESMQTDMTIEMLLECFCSNSNVCIKSDRFSFENPHELQTLMYELQEEKIDPKTFINKFLNFFCDAKVVIIPEEWEIGCKIVGEHARSPEFTHKFFEWFYISMFGLRNIENLERTALVHSECRNIESGIMESGGLNIIRPEVRVRLSNEEAFLIDLAGRKMLSDEYKSFLKERNKQFLPISEEELEKYINEEKLLVDFGKCTTEDKRKDALEAWSHFYRTCLFADMNEAQKDHSIRVLFHRFLTSLIGLFPGVCFSADELRSFVDTCEHHGKDFDGYILANDLLIWFKRVLLKLDIADYNEVMSPTSFGMALFLELHHVKTLRECMKESEDDQSLVEQLRRFILSFESKMVEGARRNLCRISGIPHALNRVDWTEEQMRVYVQELEKGIEEMFTYGIHDLEENIITFTPAPWFTPLESIVYVKVLYEHIQNEKKIVCVEEGGETNVSQRLRKNLDEDFLRFVQDSFDVKKIDLLHHLVQVNGGGYQYLTSKILATWQFFPESDDEKKDRVLDSTELLHSTNPQAIERIHEYLGPDILKSNGDYQNVFLNVYNYQKIFNAGAFYAFEAGTDRIDIVFEMYVRVFIQKIQEGIVQKKDKMHVYNELAEAIVFAYSIMSQIEVEKITFSGCVQKFLLELHLQSVLKEEDFTLFENFLEGFSGNVGEITEYEIFNGKPLCAMCFCIIKLDSIFEKNSVETQKLTSHYETMKRYFVVFCINLIREKITVTDFAKKYSLNFYTVLTDFRRIIQKKSFTISKKNYAKVVEGLDYKGNYEDVLNIIEEIKNIRGALIRPYVLKTQLLTSLANKNDSVSFATTSQSSIKTKNREKDNIQLFINNFNAFYGDIESLILHYPNPKDITEDLSKVFYYESFDGAHTLLSQLIGPTFWTHPSVKKAKKEKLIEILAKEDYRTMNKVKHLLVKFMPEWPRDMQKEFLAMLYFHIDSTWKSSLSKRLFYNDLRKELPGDLAGILDKISLVSVSITECFHVKKHASEIFPDIITHCCVHGDISPEETFSTTWRGENNVQIDLREEIEKKKKSLESVKSMVFGKEIIGVEHDIEESGYISTQTLEHMPLIHLFESFVLGRNSKGLPWVIFIGSNRNIEGKLTMYYVKMLVRPNKSLSMVPLHKASESDDGYGVEICQSFTVNKKTSKLHQDVFTHLEFLTWEVLSHFYDVYEKTVEVEEKIDYVQKTYIENLNSVLQKPELQDFLRSEIPEQYESLQRDIIAFEILRFVESVKTFSNISQEDLIKVLFGKNIHAVVDYVPLENLDVNGSKMVYVFGAFLTLLDSLVFKNTEKMKNIRKIFVYLMVTKTLEYEQSEMHEIFDAVYADIKKQFQAVENQEIFEGFEIAMSARDIAMDFQNGGITVSLEKMLKKDETQYAWICELIELIQIDSDPEILGELDIILAHFSKVFQQDISFEDVQATVKGVDVCLEVNAEDIHEDIFRRFMSIIFAMYEARKNQKNTFLSQECLNNFLLSHNHIYLPEDIKNLNEAFAFEKESNEGLATVLRTCVETLFSLNVKQEETTRMVKRHLDSFREQRVDVYLEDITHADMAAQIKRYVSSIKFGEQSAKIEFENFLQKRRELGVDFDPDAMLEAIFKKDPIDLSIPLSQNFVKRYHEFIQQFILFETQNTEKSRLEFLPYVHTFMVIHFNTIVSQAASEDLEALLRDQTLEYEDVLQKMYLWLIRVVFKFNTQDFEYAKSARGIEYLLPCITYTQSVVSNEERCKYIVDTMYDKNMKVHVDAAFESFAVQSMSDLQSLSPQQLQACTDSFSSIFESFYRFQKRNAHTQFDISLLLSVKPECGVLYFLYVQQTLLEDRDLSQEKKLTILQNITENLEEKAQLANVFSILEKLQKFEEIQHIFCTLLLVKDSEEQVGNVLREVTKFYETSAYTEKILDTLGEAYLGLNEKNFPYTSLVEMFLKTGAKDFYNDKLFESSEALCAFFEEYTNNYANSSAYTQEMAYLHDLAQEKSIDLPVREGLLGVLLDGALFQDDMLMSEHPFLDLFEKAYFGKNRSYEKCIIFAGTSENEEKNIRVKLTYKHNGNIELVALKREIEGGFGRELLETKVVCSYENGIWNNSCGVYFGILGWKILEKYFIEKTNPDTDADRKKRVTYEKKRPDEEVIEKENSEQYFIHENTNVTLTFEQRVRKFLQRREKKGPMDVNVPLEHITKLVVEEKEDSDEYEEHLKKERKITQEAYVDTIQTFFENEKPVKEAIPELYFEKALSVQEQEARKQFVQEKYKARFGQVLSDSDPIWEDKAVQKALLYKYENVSKAEVRELHEIFHDSGDFSLLEPFKYLKQVAHPRRLGFRGGARFVTENVKELRKRKDIPEEEVLAKLLTFSRKLPSVSQKVCCLLHELDHKALETDEFRKVGNDFQRDLRVNLLVIPKTLISKEEKKVLEKNRQNFSFVYTFFEEKKEELECRAKLEESSHIAGNIHWLLTVLEILDGMKVVYDVYENVKDSLQDKQNSLLALRKAFLQKNCVDKTSVASIRKEIFQELLISFQELHLAQSEENSIEQDLQKRCSFLQMFFKKLMLFESNLEKHDVNSNVCLQNVDELKNVLQHDMREIYQLYELSLDVPGYFQSCKDLETLQKIEEGIDTIMLTLHHLKTQFENGVVDMKKSSIQLRLWGFQDTHTFCSPDYQSIQEILTRPDKK